MDTHHLKKITALASSLAQTPSFIWPYVKYSPIWGNTPITSSQPWISFGALQFLKQRIRPNHEVFEYGSGGSTFYFAQRARSVVTVESHPEWHRKLTNEITSRKLSNIVCELHPISGDRSAVFQSDAYFHRVHSQLWDIILIDCYCGYSETQYGETRSFAFKLSLPQVRPGGFVVLDDSWMFPELLKPRQGWRITDYIGPGPCRYGVTSTAIFEKV